MTRTILNVPRELLERAWRALANSATGREIGAYLDADPCAPECAETCARASMCATCSADLSAPSPAGVDGLEVVGYVSQDDIKWQGDCTLRLKPYSDYVIPLCRLSAAQAIIDGLRGESHRLQRELRLRQSQIESSGRIAERAQRFSVLLRTDRDQHAQRIGELEGLLRDSVELIKHGVFEDGICCCGSSVDSHGFGDGHSPVDALAYHAGQVCERIDAALSAAKDSDQ